MGEREKWEKERNGRKREMGERDEWEKEQGKKGELGEREKEQGKKGERVRRERERRPHILGYQERDKEGEKPQSLEVSEAEKCERRISI